MLLYLGEANAPDSFWYPGTLDASTTWDDTCLKVNYSTEEWRYMSREGVMLESKDEEEALDNILKYRN